MHILLGMPQMAIPFPTLDVETLMKTLLLCTSRLAGARGSPHASVKALLSAFNLYPPSCRLLSADPWAPKIEPRNDSKCSGLPWVQPQTIINAVGTVQAKSCMRRRATMAG